MSIANIVCRSGVGPTATIALFVTHGLGIGAAIVVTKTGGDDAWVKKHYKALQERQREKVEARAELRRQIDEARNPSKPVEELTRKEKKAYKAKIEALPDLTGQLELLENELLLLVAEMELQALEMRRLREEDDIKAILMALNAPFQTIH